MAHNIIPAQPDERMLHEAVLGLAPNQSRLVKRLGIAVLDTYGYEASQTVLDAAAQAARIEHDRRRRIHATREPAPALRPDMAHTIPDDDYLPGERALYWSVTLGAVAVGALVIGWSWWVM
jgi:hypothetical protein